MSAFVILLGGHLEPGSRLDELSEGARIIAADSGMRHAVFFDRKPEAWVGDFDSTNSHLLATFSSVSRIEYPEDKDQTDGEIAINEALSRGATSLVLAGAFGGSRSDHEFVHLTLAIRLAKSGIATVLTDGSQTAYPLAETPLTPSALPGDEFSILAFDDLEGLTVQGAKWPLEEVNVPFGNSLTLSNVVQDRLTVMLRGGRALLLIHSNEKR